LIAALSKPVLIKERERDIQVSVAGARRLIQALPHAELVLLPVVNHVLKAVSSDDKEANVATYADPHPRCAGRYGGDYQLHQSCSEKLVRLRGA
jgi:hypothetical protein